MRYRDVSRAVVVHVLFLAFCCLLISALRWLIPSYSADYLLYSDSLTVDQLNEIRLQHADEVVNDTLLWKVPRRDDVEIRIVAADRRRGYLTQVGDRTFKEYLLILGCRLPFGGLSSHDPLPVPLQCGGGDVPGIGEVPREDGDPPPYWRRRRQGSSQCGNQERDAGLLGMSRAGDSLQVRGDRPYRHPPCSRYVMLLEDDALVIPEFPQLMSSLIQHLDVRPNIDYVKFYHPNYLRKVPSIPIVGWPTSFILSPISDYFSSHITHVHIPRVILRATSSLLPASYGHSLCDYSVFQCSGDFYSFCPWELTGTAPKHRPLFSFRSPPVSVYR